MGVAVPSLFLLLNALAECRRVTSVAGYGAHSRDWFCKIGSEDPGL